METFKYEGNDIRFVRQGRGTPVLLLHNGGTSHAIWKHIVPQLSGEYETFSLDLLGYGASDKPGTGYELDTYVAILRAFIDQHTSQPVALIGNCMGSAMSIAYAMRQPENVRMLVLVNPLTSATFTAGWLGLLLRLRGWAPGLSHGLYRIFRQIHIPHWLAVESLRMQFGSVGRSKELHKSEDLCACFTGSGQMPSLLGALDDLTNYAFLDTFTPPSNFPPRCTIWGLENKILSADTGRKLNTTLQPERAEWLQGCGHLPMLERPDDVARVIREFLSTHPTQGIQP